MSGVVSGGVEPPVEFRIEYCQVEGMITGMSAEPSSSSLYAILLDEARPAVVQLGENFREVVRVWFAGLVVRVPPS
jgi:hypothetical protein